MKYVIFFLFLLNSINLPAQTRWHVNAAATGLNDGLSWSGAFSSLQEALLAAQAGDEIWVAKGLYRPTVDTDRSISFEVPNSVRLYGGFSGVETTLVERDWAANLTVLSGDIGIGGDSTDNSYNVIYLFEPDSSTLIDGFEIRDGAATYGGAIPSRDRRRCGGGLYIMSEQGHAYPDIRNCRFVHNTAQGFGAGVMVNGGANGSVAPLFSTCTFENNRTISGSGGGLARFGGSLIERGNDLENCTFLRNKAGHQGGGFYYSDSEKLDRLDIYGCIFRENKATNAGGGAYMIIGRNNPSGFTVRGCDFIENIASDGAAFITNPANFLYGNYFDVDSCRFINSIPITQNFPNASVVKIELLGVSYGIGRLTNCMFNSNHKKWINLLNVEFSDAEGLIYNVHFINNDSIENISKVNFYKRVGFRNVTFSDNSNFKTLINSNIAQYATYENCLVFGNVSFTPAYYFRYNPGTTILSNCTIANNNINQAYFNSAEYETNKFVCNCTLLDIENKYWFLATKKYGEFIHCAFDTLDCNTLPSYIHCGPGNIIGIDPLFRDTASGDYSLLPCSPLINMGLDSAAAGILTDIAGAPRIQGGRVDIGAYETPAFALAAAPAVKPACAGASDGSISLQPIFGCEPYTYQWTPAAGSGPELNGLPPGQYLLNLSDGAGRQIIDTIVVPEVPKPGLSLLATDVICGQPEGGSLKALVAGGTPPFHYEWQPPATDTGFLSQRAPGDYALTLSDANGCRDSATARLTLSGLLTLLVDGQGISCYQASDGWLSAQPQNGAGPFAWHWLGWNGTDSIASALEPGQYAVTVSDAYGCTAAFTFPYMDQPDSLWAIATVSPQTEHNPANGAAAVNVVSGGTAPYDFNWSSGATDQALTGLSAGAYTVTVTDEHGCTTALEVWIDSMFTTTKEVAGEYWLLWPNPAGDWLELRFQSAIPDGNLELWSAEGKMLFSRAIHASACRLDLRGLPAGGFDVLVRDASGRVLCSKRVVKR